MNDAQRPACCIRFGSFEFNPHIRELLKSGLRMRLSGQPIEVLAMLLERPGQLVTREELQKRLWPNDTVVEFEHSINAAINRLREVLSDSAVEPRYVETLPRRGYRFIYPLEDSDGAIHLRNVPDAGAVVPFEAPSADLEGSMVSHYRIREEIGSGGMGIVYKAEDVSLDRPVALKFLPRELTTNSKALGRFRREARMASALSHPNICTIYEVGEHEGRPFIAMELLEGQTLKSYLSGKPLPLDQIVRISSQIADALETAHARGTIHRDIKPANIFITRQGITKILDFGLAKPLPESGYGGSDLVRNLSTNEAGEDLLTTPGVAIGTLAYMSPEQLRGEQLDSRTDLFSFGVVLYEMATGRQAFGGKTNAVVSEAILNRDPEPPTHLNPQLPPKFNAVVKKALEKDRTKRYVTASALGSGLATLVDVGREAHVGPRLGSRFRWVLVSLAFVFCLAALIAPTVGRRLLQWVWSPPIPEKRSVAVLPFQANSREAENQAFCRGLGEAATDKLTLLTADHRLQVMPSEGSADAQGHDSTGSSIGARRQPGISRRLLASRKHCAR
jgi:serine/threonine protein kinase